MKNKYHDIATNSYDLKFSEEKHYKRKNFWFYSISISPILCTFVNCKGTEVVFRGWRNPVKNLKPSLSFYHFVPKF